MQVDVLPVGGERGALKPGGLATFEPQPSGFCDHDALAVGNVEAGAHLAGDGDLEALGVALALEALELADAGPVGVVNDPGLALGAVAVRPGAFAD